MSEHLFPKWTDKLRDLGGLLAGGGGLYAVVIIWFGFSPKSTDVGYAPEQPIPYSHALHVGELGMDCLYCHSTVEKTGFAAIPTTSVCMNCHATIRTQSEKLRPLREAHAANLPVPWVKVHDLPDHAFFNHSAHVNQGVGCVECHGRVDRMEVVSQRQPLSMGWCLTCHRDPAPRLRPRELVTRMDWEPDEDRRVLGERLMAEGNIQPSTNCNTCHR